VLQLGLGSQGEVPDTLDASMAMVPAELVAMVVHMAAVDGEWSVDGIHVSQSVPTAKSHLITSTLSHLGLLQCYPSSLHRLPKSVLPMPDHAPRAPLIASLWPRGFGHHLRSHGHHMMIMQPCTTQATSLADMGHEGSNPLSLQSNSILLHADASLISQQQLCAYLFSFLTQ